ncbi:hypothetical protein QTO34_016123 [Cnephaeus nilssonii]|uniref:Uncharacterized protein n=1 Tax=Cnephaeus nilssonii TaxID=3371016 RepID=A0AA40I5H3_CNENI|nr:hypothetical protein QTO34_016123 [Eptesicus nilssonii]
MEENKRLDIEFKTTVIRFFKNFMEKADKFNETLEDMKKAQLEMKHTLTEIKNIIQRPSSRLEERKNQVKDLEYKEAKDTPPEKQEEKRIQKVEDSVRSLWDNFKRTSIRIFGVPEEEREQDAENLFEEIMTENFPHLGHGFTRIQGPTASPGPGIQPHPDLGAHGLAQTQDSASSGPRGAWPHPDPGAHGLSQTQGRVASPPGRHPPPPVQGPTASTQTRDPGSPGSRGPRPRPDPGPRLTRVQGPTASPGPGPRLTRVQGPTASPGSRGPRPRPDPATRSPGSRAHGLARTRDPGSPRSRGPRRLQSFNCRRQPGWSGEGTSPITLLLQPLPVTTATKEQMPLQEQIPSCLLSIAGSPLVPKAGKASGGGFPGLGLGRTPASLRRIPGAGPQLPAIRRRLPTGVQGQKSLWRRLSQPWARPHPSVPATDRRSDPQLPASFRLPLVPKAEKPPAGWFPGGCSKGTNPDLQREFSTQKKPTKSPLKLLTPVTGVLEPSRLSHLGMVKSLKFPPCITYIKVIERICQLSSSSALVLGGIIRCGGLGCIGNACDCLLQLLAAPPLISLPHHYRPAAPPPSRPAPDRTPHPNRGWGWVANLLQPLPLTAPPLIALPTPRGLAGQPPAISSSLWALAQSAPIGAELARPHLMNTTQKRYAICSALAASAFPALVISKDHHIEEVPELPLVVEDKVDGYKKTKEADLLLKKLKTWTDIKKNHKLQMDKAAAAAAAVLEVKLDEKEVPSKMPVVGKKGKKAVGIMKQKFLVGKKATAIKKPAAENPTEKKPTTEEKMLVA